MSTSPLHRLIDYTGKELPNLVAARETTERRFEARRGLLRDIALDEHASVVFVGSWGRAEVTSASDDDYMVLVEGDGDGRPPVDEVTHALQKDPEGFRPPGPEGMFAQQVHGSVLVERIGLDKDTNTNLTQRMLLLLESRPLLGSDSYERVKGQALEAYLEDAVKDYWPPRFLLNDIVRYWRTMAVDFAAKMRERDDPGWGLRNAKLRTSRKLLFASGLLPVIRAHEFRADEMVGFLGAQLAMPPADRVADAFLAYHQLDDGVAVLSAYDQFLGMLSDAAIREELKRLPSGQAAQESAHFATAERLGYAIEEGLLNLLFGPALGTWTRRVGIF
jgi:hypothetical protein